MSHAEDNAPLNPVTLARVVCGELVRNFLMNTEDMKALFAAAAEDNNQREAERGIAVAKLDELNDDPECDHQTAEKIILEYLRLRGETAVAEAFERACERVGFWYS